MSVDASGVSLLDSTGGLIFGSDIEFDNGLVYSTGGQVVDPTTLTLVGTFGSLSSPALVEPDSSLGRAFFLIDNFGTTAETSKSFDISTFAEKGSLDIPAVSVFFWSSLIRWGSNGLAFRTGGGHVFLITSVPE